MTKRPKRIKQLNRRNRLRGFLIWGRRIVAERKKQVQPTNQ
jgi:hypothetical protein